MERTKSATTVHKKSRDEDMKLPKILSSQRLTSKESDSSTILLKSKSQQYEKEEEKERRNTGVSDGESLIDNPLEQVKKNKIKLYKHNSKTQPELSREKDETSKIDEKQINKSHIFGQKGWRDVENYKSEREKYSGQQNLKEVVEGFCKEKMNKREILEDHSNQDNEESYSIRERSSSVRKERSTMYEVSSQDSKTKVFDKGVQQKSEKSFSKKKGLPIASKNYYRVGYLARKYLLERGGRKPRSRKWKGYYVMLAGGVVYFFKADEMGTPNPDLCLTTTIPLPIASQIMERASLLHSYTQVMPSPGYSTLRPHVLALTLKSGEIYLFQTYTAQQASDWAFAFNYWAALKSKEPNFAGISITSNLEYGWKNTFISNSKSKSKSNSKSNPASLSPTLSSSNLSALSQLDTQSQIASSIKSIDDKFETSSTKSNSNSKSKSKSNPKSNSKSKSKSKISLYTNENSSKSNKHLASIHKFVTDYNNSNSNSTNIVDWVAPKDPDIPSVNNELEQIKAFSKHSAYLDSELISHKAVFITINPNLPTTSTSTSNSTSTSATTSSSSSSSIYNKAFHNWEKKAQYLLHEL
ncbi:PH and SEC7 domain-containing protein 4, partial [Zancudomyces culisetae]